MNSVILLDSGPLGMVSHPKANPAIVHWIATMLKAKADIRIPEISDYEVRRELLRAKLVNSIQRLDQLQQNLKYEPLSTPAMQLAALLWAKLRNQGTRTAVDKALDGDVILAAQALILAQSGAEVIVATDNVAHLSLMTPASNWDKISL